MTYHVKPEYYEQWDASYETIVTEGDVIRLSQPNAWNVPVEELKGQLIAE